MRRSTLEKVEQEILNRAKRSLPHIQNISKKTITYIPSMEHPKIALFFRNLFLDFDYSKLDKEKINRIYLPLKILANKNTKTVTIQYFTKKEKVNSSFFFFLE